jgi:hypothetical protein
LKFGDVVICAASIAVIAAFIHFPLDLVFVSALGLTSGYGVGVLVVFFLSALITGYIFAGKIWEARMEATAKISVLWAVFVILIMKFEASTAHWGPYAEEAYQGQYGNTLSNLEWVHWESMYMDMFVFLFVIAAFALGFIGLYAGSMLRKPKKG